MILRFLGTHNAESKNTRLVSFLIDEVLAIDAGSLVFSPDDQDIARVWRIIQETELRRDWFSSNNDSSLGWHHRSGKSRLLYTRLPAGSQTCHDKTHPARNRSYIEACPGSIV